MTREFEKHVVVVTGASAGIGAAFAEEVARRGASVVLVARREEKLKAVADRIGAQAMIAVADVTRRAEVEGVLASAVKRFGQVDVWVNNAGRGITHAFEEISDEDLDVMLRDNVKSAVYGMQTALGHFKSRGQGVLVNVSSQLARHPSFPARGAYSASKAALSSLAEGLRFELEQDWPGIRVVTVIPGVVATEFGKNAVRGGQDSRAIPGAQTTEEVARIMADGIAAKRRDVYTRPEGYDVTMKYLEGLNRA